ncbi:MAG TPA: class I adenylate-forming enzyme family protein [Rhizomicrobium sp.]|nr:class I adenylate-forming enzyme family protein [Rhizomicrobium sp.]
MIVFADWLRFHASMRPAEMAFATPRVRLTFAQLYETSLCIAARLHGLGLQPGQKAAIFAVNPALQYSLLVAVNRLGLCGCILPQWESRRSSALEAVAFDWILTDTALEPEAKGRKVDVELQWLAEHFPHDDLPPRKHMDSDAHCLLAISSGTVSKSKPIAFTGAQLERRITWRGFEEQATTPGEKTYVMLSAASMLSFLTTFGTLYAGGCIYSGWPPERAAAVIAREGINRLVSTPPLLVRQMPAFEKLGPYPHLRLVYSGGEMLFEGLSRRVTEILCPNLVTAFGTNETGQIAVGRVDRMGYQPQRVGFILPWADAEAVDRNDKPLPPGTEGELRFRTPGMASGYLDNPDATAAQFRNGWFYPGDVGTITKDGALIMAGRLADLITTQQGHLSPRTIDVAASEFEGVGEAAAFGVRRGDGLDDIWLAVAGRDDLDMEKLRGFCAAKFGGQAPQHFLKLAQLPRNESGKVLRWALVDIATGKSA